MARRCGCASDSCSCEVVGGDGIIVTGAGSPRNPYIVTSTVAQIETGFDVQYNNVDVVRDVHQIDFRGTAVQVTPGVDEIVVTVNQPDPVSGYSVPTGAMWMFGAGVAPSGWLMCDGQTYLVADYPGLFAVIGNAYGGDGTVNFKVPNLIDRFPVGASATKPASELGGGTPSKSIAVANLPPHGHDISHGHGAVNSSFAGNHDHELRLSGAVGSQNTAVKGQSNYSSPRDPINSDGAHQHSVTVTPHYGNSGPGDGTATPLDIIPPWMALAFIIKT